MSWIKNPFKSKESAPAAPAVEAKPGRTMEQMLNDGGFLVFLDKKRQLRGVEVSVKDDNEKELQRLYETHKNVDKVVQMSGEISQGELKERFGVDANRAAVQTRLAEFWNNLALTDEDEFLKAKEELEQHMQLRRTAAVNERKLTALARAAKLPEGKTVPEHLAELQNQMDGLAGEKGLLFAGKKNASIEEKMKKIAPLIKAAREGHDAHAALEAAKAGIKELRESMEGREEFNDAMRELAAEHVKDVLGAGLKSKTPNLAEANRIIAKVVARRDDAGEDVVGTFRVGRKTYTLNSIAEAFFEKSRAAAQEEVQKVLDAGNSNMYSGIVRVIRAYRNEKGMGAKRGEDVDDALIPDFEALAVAHAGTPKELVINRIIIQLKDHSV